MPITPVFAEDSAPPAAPYSPGVKVGNLLYCSGQIPMTSSGEIIKGSITEQTIQIFKNIEGILKSGGSGLDKIIKVNIFMLNLQYFGELNKVYGTYFPNVKPARSCVAVAGLPLGVDVEIEVVALCEETESKL